MKKNVLAKSLALAAALFCASFFVACSPKEENGYIRILNPDDDSISIVLIINVDEGLYMCDSLSMIGAGGSKTYKVTPGNCTVRLYSRNWKDERTTEEFTLKSGQKRTVLNYGYPFLPVDFNYVWRSVW